MSNRGVGLVLFLPVPLVLWLLTHAPFGVGASLGVGVLLMLSHRLYARPFALLQAAQRCLWCGGAAGPEAHTLEIQEPMGTREWRACGPAHLAKLRRTIGWAWAHRRRLQVGILGSLLVFLGLSVLALAGRGLVSHATAADLFRFGVAVTVVPLAWFGPRHGLESETVRAPFPVHIQALIGTAAVLWLFRVVGSAWLGVVLWHVVRGSAAMGG